ncbi:Disulfide bond formation protein B [Rickettsiales endosymbiont of Paramecium tredecaurelia]|uniref:disulfide bond formation protein B n=1 Tax=Candidatus Sarmatiella mevalonica TaxID=2770581 RepID=UPI001922FC15|nr:disulfide bond formation protein B [Candidatus Sarmatiella mevalonica]MBL3284970.1 Disulfide bond formation protein B [Candidatus Sarmatiella mevalonica]
MYHQIIQRLSVNNFRLIHFCIAAFCTSALLFVFLLERVANLNPCQLCILERIPCTILLCTSLLALILKQGKCRLYALLLEVAVLILSCFLGIIHVLIEHGTISSFCISSIDYSAMSLEGSIESVMQQDFRPDCAQNSFKILFFSLSEINLMCNFVICFVVCSVVNASYKKNATSN